MARSSTSTFPPKSPPPPTRAVLLVDDDEPFRQAVAALLRDDGYQVFDYGDPSQVPPLDGFETAIALIVDYRMSSSDGVTFADRFHRAHRAAPVVIITSYITAPLESEVAARPYMHLLCKPIDYERLVAFLA